jgi:chaperonin GroES
MRLLNDQLAVEPLVETKTTGGIIIPEGLKNNTGKAKILATGPGRHLEKVLNSNGEPVRIPLDVQVDDIVIYHKGAGIEVEVDGKKVTLITEQSVLAIV